MEAKAPPRPRARKPVSLPSKYLILGATLVLLAVTYWFARDVLYHRLVYGIGQVLLNDLGSFSVEKIGHVEMDAQGDIKLYDTEVWTTHKGERRLFYRARQVGLSLSGFPGRDPDLHVMRVDLHQPEIFIRREADGEWNVEWAFQRLPRPDKPKPISPPPRTPGSDWIDPDFPTNGVHIYDGIIHVALCARSGREVSWTLTAVRAVLEKKNGVLSIQPLVADFYGGRLIADISASSTQPLAVDVQVRVTGATTRRIAERLPLKRPVLGKFDAVLSLTSSREKTGRKPIAAGHATIKEGDLWELPAFAGILAVLALDPSQERKLESAEVQFLVEEDRILISQMDFLGSPVCLFGSGQMDLNGDNLEIVFLPRLGRKSLNDIIPIAGFFIQVVLDIAKGIFVPVVVTGSFTNPQIDVRPGYIIAKPLRDLVDKKSPTPSK